MYFKVALSNCFYLMCVISNRFYNLLKFCPYQLNFFWTKIEEDEQNPYLKSPMKISYWIKGKKMTLIFSPHTHTFNIFTWILCWFSFSAHALVISLGGMSLHNGLKLNLAFCKAINSFPKFSQFLYIQTRFMSSARNFYVSSAYLHIYLHINWWYFHFKCFLLSASRFGIHQTPFVVDISVWSI